MAQEEHTRLLQKKTNSHFYQRFQTEYHAFSQAIQGISAANELQTYTTLLLRRLMVLYFLQGQGLLDSRKPGRTQGDAPTFIAQMLNDPDISSLALPLFQVHPIEQNTPHIQITTDALIRLCAFFDTYTWNLQEWRHTAEQNELSPEILGGIFEQQINQKQTGAYYTQDDVTSYITKNTLLPYLLHAIEARYPQEFAPASAVWQLLQDRPERYISASLRSENALPGETQQEYRERRARYQQLSTQLKTGQIHSIHDLITYNLDIALFMQDGIAYCLQPELVLALYKAIAHISILDPTCGSGAFLCAAANTLEPLYASCLDRIQALADGNVQYSFSRTAPDAGCNEEYLERCSSILKKVQAYPTRRHFILTSIINNNLYGVDIMEEATQICQLRLFLALAACSTKIEDVPAFSSLRWHIVPGNALVGAIQDRNDSKMQDRREMVMQDRRGREIHVDKSVDAINRVPTFGWFESFPHIMGKGGFDIIVGNPPYIEYNKVKQQYTVAGYETLSYGNLYAAVFARSLELCHAGSYIGLIVPLSVCSSERFGPLRRMMTSQLAQIWLANFEIFPSRLFDGAFQRLSIVIAQHGIANQHGRVNHNGIINRAPTSAVRDTFMIDRAIYTTRIQRWYAVERPHLIDRMSYVQVQCTVKETIFPKLASPLQETILHKLVEKAGRNCIASMLSPCKTEHFVYYQEATNYWMKATRRVPYYKKNGKVMEPAHGRLLYFREQRTAHVVMALMNSSLFYLWFATFSDGFHLSHGLVKGFPLWGGLCEQEDLELLALQLEEDIKKHARMSTRNTKMHEIELEEYRMSASKGLLDEIDRVLGRYYGLSDEEVEFVVRYDRKYRMGKDSENSSGERVGL